MKYRRSRIKCLDIQGWRCGLVAGGIGDPCCALVDTDDAGGEGGGSDDKGIDGVADLAKGAVANVDTSGGKTGDRF